MSFTPETQPKKRHSNKHTLVAIGIVLLMLLSFVGGYFMQRITRPPQVQTIVEVVELIDKVGYVYDPETGKYVELDGEKVAESIANNFLDQYSAYYTKEEYTKIKEQAKGNYKGFGVSYDVTNNRVIKVVGNSPAEKAGLKVGDKITAGKKVGDEEATSLIDGQTVSEFLTNCVNDSEYTFTVERFNTSSNEKEFPNISMQKSAYKATYVKYYDSEGSASFTYDGATLQMQTSEEILSELVNPNPAEQNPYSKVFVVKLDAFEGQAYEQIVQAFDYADSRDKTQLVLDLRGNGGGQMDILVKICSLLLYSDNNEPIRIAYAKEKKDVTAFSVSVEETNYRGFEKISIVADENTASASECLIGAMLYHHAEKYNNPDKDYYENYNNTKCSVFGYGRLIIAQDEFGEARTYGKGIMQTTYELVSGGALKLTTAKLIWPPRPSSPEEWEKATCIHGTGITVDMGAQSAKAEDALKMAIENLEKDAILKPAPDDSQTQTPDDSGNA